MKKLLTHPLVKSVICPVIISLFIGLIGFLCNFFFITYPSTQAQIKVIEEKITDINDIKTDIKEIKGDIKKLLSRR